MSKETLDGRMLKLDFDAGLEKKQKYSKKPHHLFFIYDIKGDHTSTGVTLGFPKTAVLEAMPETITSTEETNMTIEDTKIIISDLLMIIIVLEEGTMITDLTMIEEMIANQVEN